VIVPLYNRGHIKRNEIMPFVLGANIGTLFDTLIVAIALNTAVGVLTVLALVTEWDRHFRSRVGLLRAIQQARRQGPKSDRRK